MNHRSALILALVALACLAAPGFASPRDTKVGDVRAVFAKGGVPLRDTASALAPSTGTLVYGTQVRVLEAKLPWIRIETVPAQGQQPRTGWLRAYETVEASALSSNAVPAHTAYTGDVQVNSKEVSAVGRQLDAATEKGFRADRKDLERAYRLVDAMEKATADMDPSESILFIVQGDLGRSGRDYARPGRVAATSSSSSRAAKQRKAGGLLGKLAGAGLRAAGVDDDVARVGEALTEAASGYVADIKQSFSPQQEYYLGRAVAAKAIAQYGVDKSAERRRYVRQVGDAVVRLSSRLPANFGGYHFEVLDSDDINGVSGPGGFVLITRGAVEAARSEAELAGVLSHELAHSSRKHGESLLRQGKKFPSMVGNLAGAAGKAAGAGEFSQGLVKFFTSAVQEMSGTAINDGYGRNLEFDADREATHILFDVYYDQTAVKTFLLHMREGQEQHGHSSTHASPVMRAQALDPVIAAYPPFTPSETTVEARSSRFAQEMKRTQPVPSFGSGR